MTDQTRELNTGFELGAHVVPWAFSSNWRQRSSSSSLLPLSSSESTAPNHPFTQHRQTKKCWHHGEVHCFFWLLHWLPKSGFPTHIIYEYSVPQNSGLRAPQNSGLRIKCQWLNDHEYMLGWLGHHRFRYPLPPSTCLHGACLRKWGCPKMSLVLAGKMTTTYNNYISNTIKIQTPIIVNSIPNKT